MYNSADIWYLASSKIPSMAANSVHVISMCEALESTGLNVALFSPVETLTKHASLNDIRADYGAGLRARLKHIVKPQTRGGGFFYRFQVYTRLLFSRPEFVYGRCHEGCLVTAKMGVPTALELHQAVWQRNEYSYQRFTSFINSKGFRGVVVISDALKRDLIEEFPSLVNHVLVAHDAARDFGYTPYLPVEGSSRIQVFYTGSLHPGKGMEIITQLAKRCSWADFNIVGGDAESIKKWKGLAGENVNFLGHRPASEISSLLKNSHVLIAPYLQKVAVHGGGADVGRWMSPLKIFEYMAANRPIIASDLPVLREVLTDGENALLVSPDDIEAWADRLSQLRDDPALALSLANNARRHFEDSHTWHHRARNIMGFLGWLPSQKK